MSGQDVKLIATRHDYERLRSWRSGLEVGAEVMIETTTIREGYVVSREVVKLEKCQDDSRAFAFRAGDRWFNRGGGLRGKSQYGEVTSIVPPLSSWELEYERSYSEKAAHRHHAECAVISVRDVFHEVAVRELSDDDLRALAELCKPLREWIDAHELAEQAREAAEA